MALTEGGTKMDTAQAKARIEQSLANATKEIANADRSNHYAHISIVMEIGRASGYAHAYYSMGLITSAELCEYSSRVCALLDKTP